VIKCLVVADVIQAPSLRLRLIDAVIQAPMPSRRCRRSVAVEPLQSLAPCCRALLSRRRVVGRRTLPTFCSTRHVFKLFLQMAAKLILIRIEH
jgi:hypothetical protein